jgi:hypothetical protein
MPLSLLRTWAILAGKRMTPLAHVALLVIHVSALVAMSSPWPLMDGFPLDDAWIHQVVARTFASEGTLGYAPGQHGAGATSYLWAAILAVNFKWLHVSPVVYTLAINVGLALASSQLLLAIILRTARGDRSEGLHTLRALLATALATIGGNCVWFAFCGMEANLVVFLFLLLIFNFAVGEASVKKTNIAGAAAGLLALTRPDTAVLGALVIATAPWVRRKISHAAIAASQWALGSAIYVGSNLYFVHAMAPATLRGRSWLWVEGSGLDATTRITEFVTAWLDRLRNYALGTSSNVAFWIAVGFCLVALFRLITAKERGLLLLCIIGLAHICMYAVMLPTPGHGGRYQPLTPLLFLALVALGSIDWLTTLTQRVTRSVAIRWVVQPVAIAAWVALVIVGLLDWRKDHALAVAHVRATEAAAGEAINSLPPGNVASFDIGGTGFFAKRPILDIGGLSDPAVAGLLQQGRVWEYLRDHQIAYVVLPLGYGNGALPDPVDFGARLSLRDNPAVKLEPLRLLESPPDVWIRGARATQHSAPKQGIFRISYTHLSPLPREPSNPAARPLPLDASMTIEPARLKATLTTALKRLAGADILVRFVVTTDPEQSVEQAPNAWLVRMGQWGIAATAPADRPKEWSTLATALMGEWVQPFMDIKDYGSGALGALHMLAAFYRRVEPARPLPELPAVEPPQAPHSASPMDTVIWGGILAIMVVLLGQARIAKLLAMVSGLRLRARPLRTRSVTIGAPLEERE